MKRLSLAGIAVVVVGCLTYTSILTQEAEGKKSAASRGAAARTALCKSDCLPDNTHGLYKSYHATDPKLVSLDGRKQYAECVQKCVAPLPDFYVQKPIFALGLDWFGKSADSCYDCHIRGTRK